MALLKKIFIILFFCILFLLALSSIKKKPMSAKESMLVHMEEKYDETFEFIEEKRGRAYKSGYTIRLASTQFPEADIMVTQLKDGDGSVIYLDNYMSYVYYSEAKQWIEEAIGSVFDDFWVYFPIPRGTFDINPDRFGIEDYLREEQADLSITVLIFGEDANDKNLEALINSFAQNGIVTECTAVFTSREHGEAAASKETLSKYMAKTGWYEGIADFWVLADGRTGYRSWRE